MHVFISHSRQNSAPALKLSDVLIARGVKVWLDVRDLETGADWQAKVAEAIHTAQGFVFLIGPPGPPDQWQRFEWQKITEGEFYLDPEKPLIPVVIGRTELPGFLRTRQPVVVSESSIDFGALADTVMQSLNKPDETVDHEKIKLGRAARKQALESLKEYSVDLEKEDAKQAGLRGLK